MAISRQQIKIKQTSQTFSLRFTPLRPIRNEEWALLNATLHLIVEYGAIGGKTVFKPSDEPGREEKAPAQGLWPRGDSSIHRRRMAQSMPFKSILSQDTWRKPDHDGFVWASLQNFWCVKGKISGSTERQHQLIQPMLSDAPEPKQQSGQWAIRGSRVAGLIKEGT